MLKLKCLRTTVYCIWRDQLGNMFIYRYKERWIFIIKRGSKNYFDLNASKTKAMIVGTRSKLKMTVDPAPFNAGNSRMMFVKSFVYLGTTLDTEMTLEPLYKNVSRRIDQKLFILRKIRRYITVEAAKAMYKQMILPLIDYNGFLCYPYMFDVYA